MKKTLLLVLFLALLTSLFPDVSGASEIDLRTREKDFTEKALNAVQKKDERALAALMVEYEAVAFNAIMSRASLGIRARADGQWQSDYHFDIAKIMARAFAKQFNKQEFAQLIDRYATYSKDEAKTRMQAEALWRDAVSLTRAARWEEAQEAATKALTIYGTLGDKTREADSLSVLGVIYKNRQKEKECLSSNEGALQIMERLGNIRGARIVLNNTGAALSQFGRYEEAIPYYQKALALDGKISDSSQELNTLKALADAYDQLLENKQAIATYDLALNIAKEQGDRLEEERILIKAAVINSQLDQYQDAIPRLERALALSQELKDFHEQYVALWHLGFVCWRMGENERAREYSLKGLQAAVASGDEQLQARALGNVGEIHERTGKYNEALDHYLKALALYQKTEDPANEAKTLHDLGKVLNSLGRYRESLDFFRKASEKTKGLDDPALAGKNLVGMSRAHFYLREYGLASENLMKATELMDENDIMALADISELLGMIGLETGQLTDAAHWFESALKDYRLMKLNQDEVRILIYLGRVCDRLGENGKALGYFKDSAAMSKAAGDLKGEASAFLQLGSLMGRMGRYSESLDCLTNALDLAQKSGNPGDILSAHDQIGRIYLSVGDSPKARDHYEQALRLARESGDKGREGDILLDIAAIICFYEGNLKEGLRVITEDFEKAHSVDDLAAVTRSGNLLGQMFMQIGQDDKALEIYLGALKNYRTLNDAPNESLALLNIGIIYYNLGRFDEAARELNAALQIADRLNQLEDIWWAEAALGRTLRRTGKPADAVRHFQKAVAIIEEIYSHTSGFGEEERSLMMREKSFVYQEFIELLLELHRKDPGPHYDRQAFVIAEKGKSRAFQELMAKAGAKTVFAGDETFKKMVAQEQQLIIELTNLRALLLQELSKPEKRRSEEVVRSLEDQVARAEKSLTDIDKEIDAKYPRYADLKRPRPLGVEELQETLRPGEALVAYALGKEKTIAFVIGKDSFTMNELAVGPGELTQLVKRFRQGVAGVKELTDLESFKPEVAAALYQKLLAPLAAELKGTTRLYISGDGILYTLPFEALVDREVDQRTFREARRQGKQGGGAYLGEYATLHYLADTCTITYLPSAAVLRSLRMYEKPGYGRWARPLIAFADPVFDPEEEKSVHSPGLKGRGLSAATQLTSQLLTRSTGTDKLERLKESAEEVAAIKKEVKGKKEDVYLRSQASEMNVYRPNLKNTRYLLFSTHGLLGGDFSGVAEPALALTLIDNPPGVDGFLTMSEVLGLDLNAELVVLSACNTSGRGDKAGSGEGFVGLTRSFMYAGTRAILVTHWSVESQAARDLMAATFKEMPKKAKPEALRASKLKMKGSTRNDQSVPGGKLSMAHPFFWAPFVLVGEGN